MEMRPYLPLPQILKILDQRLSKMTRKKVKENEHQQSRKNYYQRRKILCSGNQIQNKPFGPLT